MRLHLATLLTALIAINGWMVLNAVPRERPKSEWRTGAREFGFPWIVYEQWSDEIVDTGINVSDWKVSYEGLMEDSSCGFAAMIVKNRARFMTTQKFGLWEVHYLYQGWRHEAVWANAVLGIFAVLGCVVATEVLMRRRVRIV